LFSIITACLKGFNFMAKFILSFLLLGTSSLFVAQNLKPGNKAEIFGRDIISLNESNEHTCTFSPDGTTIYFTRDANVFISSKIDGKWSSPKITDIKGREAIFSPDGNRLFYGDGDIWFLEKKDKEWSSPQKLPSSINTDSYEYYASSSNDGSLYFSRIIGKHALILASRFENGHYLEAIDLPSPINQDSSNNYHPFISSEEDYIIFNSERNGGYGGADLYISFKDVAGNWKEPVNLGNKINSNLRDICPTITPDGKYLFFTRNWQKDNKWFGDIYFIETSFPEWKKEE
jgi:Tol biopolymer transport system component